MLTGLISRNQIGFPFDNRFPVSTANTFLPPMERE